MPLTSSFDLDVTGIRDVERRFRALGRQARDRRSMYAKLVTIFKRSAAQTFDSEGSALTGRRWAPLNPEYARQKAKAYPGRPILVRTGKLRASLVEKPTVRFAGNSMSIGTNVSYSQYHQQGTRFMPRRKHVGLTIGARQAWKREVREHLLRREP